MGISHTGGHDGCDPAKGLYIVNPLRVSVGPPPLRKTAQVKLSRDRAVRSRGTGLTSSPRVRPGREEPLSPGRFAILID